MRALKSLLFATVLAVSAHAAHAFDQQTRDTPAPGLSTDLGAEAGPESSSPGSTSLELPGIGNLGVIPKLDFGLELLYGDRRPADIEQDQALSSDEDGLRVRGTIRHRF